MVKRKCWFNTIILDTTAADKKQGVSLNKNNLQRDEDISSLK